MPKDKEVKFVTGGCGFVGRHVAESILAEGDEVWVLDNLFTGKHPDTWLKGYVKRQERELLKKAKQDILQTFKDAPAITLFGSAARGQGDHL